MGSIYELDGRVPLIKAVPFGLQHVLAMFVANITPIMLLANVAGIEAGKIGAAGLEVVENEFGLYYYDRKSDVLVNRELAILRGFPNVTVTHHMAFYTDDCVETVVRDSLLGCQLFAEGKENPWEVA